MPHELALIRISSIQFGITFISQFQLIPSKLSYTPNFNPFNSNWNLEVNFVLLSVEIIWTDFVINEYYVCFP